MTEFKVGDRVRVNCDYLGLPYGREGTVTKSYDELVDVRLDGRSFDDRGWYPSRFTKIEAPVIKVVPQFVPGDIVRVVDASWTGLDPFKDGELVMVIHGNYRETWSEQDYVDVQRLDGTSKVGMYVSRFEKARLPNPMDLYFVTDTMDEDDEEFIVADGEQFIFSAGWETYEEALEEAKNSARDDGEIAYYVYKRVATVTSTVEVEVLEG